MPGPIEHVVILVKENHGFDNYFGRFPGADGDGTLANAANPPAVDPSHTHKAWLNRATGAVREQFGAADIPIYWAYAQQYTLCDRYFTEIAGPSTPNHLMLIAADSPWIDNPPGNYRVQSTQVVDIPSLPGAARAGRAHVGQLRRLRVRVRQGARRKAAARRRSSQPMPPPASCRPSRGSTRTTSTASTRPTPPPTGRTASATSRTARRGLRQQIDAIVAGGLWDKTAIFVTWDDWGGWADHVDPPEVETVERRHAVPLRQPRPVPRPRRIREGGLHLAPAALARQPRPLLRDDLRSAVAERAHRGRRRHGRLLRLHTRAAAAQRGHPCADTDAAPDADARADAAGPDGSPPQRDRGRRGAGEHRIAAAAATTDARQAAAALRRDGRHPRHELATGGASGFYFERPSAPASAIITKTTSRTAHQAMLSVPLCHSRTSHMERL